MKRHRICVTVDDLCLVFGVGRKQAERKLRHMKDAFGRTQGQYITFREFSSYTGIPLEELDELCFPKRRE